MSLFDLYKGRQAIKFTTRFPEMVPENPCATQNHPEPELWQMLSQGRGELDSLFKNGGVWDFHRPKPFPLHCPRYALDLLN